MKAQQLPNLKCDFSSLSRGRLRTYNMLAEELERMEEEANGVFELEDDMIEMLAAAGVNKDDREYARSRRKHRRSVKQSD